MESWKVGDNAHIEVPGRAGFTGATPLVRAYFAGWTTVKTVGETMNPDTQHNILLLLDTIYHRQVMMVESLTDVGISSEDQLGTITDYGYATTQSNASTYVGIYPVDKQTGVALTHAMEDPNPFTDADATANDMCTKTSYPISLQSQISTRLSVTSFTVKEFGSADALSGRIFQPGSKDITDYTSFWVGNTPFKPFTTYDVRVIGKVSGGLAGTGFNVDKTWSFTTGVNLITCPNLPHL